MKNLFIVGCPRSGTTMLQQALNRHSRIVIPPETKLFYWFYGQPWRVQRRHLERLKADLGVDLPPPRRRRQTPDEVRGYFDGMAARYLNRLSRREVEYFGDKTPEHTSQIDRIREVFPEAKFLFLYRDGRDVALSLTRVPWIRCNVYGGFAVWLYYYRMLLEAICDDSLDILYVRYEKLARWPERELERIAAFLGVEYEPAMATAHGNAEGIPPRELSWKGRALEPISAERIERWRRELSAAEIQDLEWLGFEELSALDYPLSTPVPQPASRLLRIRMALEEIRCACQLPWPVLFNEVGRSLRSVALRRNGRSRADSAMVQARLSEQPCVAFHADGRMRSTSGACIVPPSAVRGGCRMGDVRCLDSRTGGAVSR